MPRRRATRRKCRKYVTENTIVERARSRDVVLLECGWSPELTKFGEQFKGKNRILIAEEK